MAPTSRPKGMGRGSCQKAGQYSTLYQNWIRSILPLVSTVVLSCAGPHTLQATTHRDERTTLLFVGRVTYVFLMIGVSRPVCDPGFEILPHTNRTVPREWMQAVLAHAQGVHSGCNLALIVPGVPLPWRCPPRIAQEATCAAATALPLERQNNKPGGGALACALALPHSTTNHDSTQKQGGEEEKNMRR